MRLIWSILILLVALWIVLGCSLFIPESESVKGKVHPTFKSMARGGSGEARHRHLMWIGGIFGTLQMILFVLILALGARRRESSPRMSSALIIGGVLLLVVFGQLMLNYHLFLTESRLSFLGPLPTPTTMTVVGIWAAPFFFVILYLVTFSRHFWTKEDEQKFQNLLKATREDWESD